MNLADEYLKDRTLTKTMVESTFHRDNVPEELITEYFESYDKETSIGLKIAKWLDSNRVSEDEEVIDV